MKNQSLKPGSSPHDAKKIGGKGDFGVRESDVTERTYTSANTRHSDPGNARPRGGTTSRESGVGADASGPGSASGGDVDTDFAGIGSGRGFSQNGPDKGYQGGPDEAQPFSSRSGQAKSSPAQNLNASESGQSTIVREVSNDFSQGADAATNPAARQDDSFAAEVSSDEISRRNDQ